MDSLQVTDAASAAVAVAPRVKLDDIKAAIAARIETTADKVAALGFEMVDTAYEVPKIFEPLQTLSICLLVMKNGFTVIGKAAPASPENFKRELGKQYAYEDAIRQLWPLMGYALREKLADG